jgi:hypothetical protein
MSDDTRRNELLITGLVGSDYAYLYQTNAWFRQGIDVMARMLPLFVDGLALDAKTKNDAQRATVDQLMKMPPLLPPAQEREEQ